MYEEIAYQLVLTKWNASPFLLMMSRPLVDNGSTDSARFGKEDGMAEASEERAPIEIKLRRSIMEKDVREHNVTATQKYTVVIFYYLFILYTVHIQMTTVAVREGRQSRLVSYLPHTLSSHLRGSLWRVEDYRTKHRWTSSGHRHGMRHCRNWKRFQSVGAR